MLLKIKPSSIEIKEMYNNHGTYHKGDSGLDLFVPDKITVKANSIGYPINMKISCEANKLNMNEYVKNIHSVLKTDNSDESRDVIESLKNIQIKHDNCSYYLYPRSSISKTPLRMSNSMGIIDAGYRGEIIAKVDNLTDTDYILEKGVRLFQICDASLEPIEIKIVDSLSETTRGEGGFGSTG